MVAALREDHIDLPNCWFCSSIMSISLLCFGNREFHHLKLSPCLIPLETSVVGQENFQWFI